MADREPARGIVVLGIRRAGTSAVTRLLNLLGAEVGPNPTAPVPGDNEVGSWEPLDIVSVHDALLKALGSTWQETAPLPPQWWHDPKVVPYRDEIVRIARNRFGESPLWVVKDPRLCRLLPMWSSIMAQLRSKPACLLITRNPHEVADSLVRSDDIPPSHSYLLWLDHVLSAEEHSRKFPRVFVTYAQLLEDWKNAMNRASRVLGITWPRALEDAAPEVDHFLSPELRQHQVPNAVLQDDPDMALWVTQVYAELRRAAAQGETMRLRSRLAVVRRQMTSAMQLFHPQTMPFRAEAGKASEDLVCVQSELGEARAELGEAQRALAEVRRQTADLRWELRVLQDRFAENQREERTRFEEKEEETVALREALQATQSRLDLATTLRHQREGEVRLLRASLSWRVTRPLRLLWDFSARQRAAVHTAGTSSHSTPPETLENLAATSPAVAKTATPTSILDFPRVENPRVTIVIPAFNRFAYTYSCLESIMRHTDEPSYEVLVVDDHSTDATHTLERVTTNVRVLRNSENLGFVHSCNRGAKAAGGRYLVFLNSDTRVTERWLDALLEPWSRNTEVGLVGGRLVYPDGRLQEAGGVVFSDGTCCNFGRDGDPENTCYNFVREVDYCSGACLAIRRDLFFELGMFDERYAPAYYEDVDLAFAVRAAGKTVIYQPAAEIAHEEGATAGTDLDSGTKRFQTVNCEKFVAKWSEALVHQPAPGYSPDIRRHRRTVQRILVVDLHTPTPDRDAGSLRMYEILRTLRRLDCDVCFIPQDLVHAGKYTHAIQAIGIEALYLPYLESIEQHLEQSGSRYDAVFLSRVDVAKEIIAVARRCCRKAKIIFDTVDLHFVRESRQAAVEKGVAPARRKGEELAVAWLADLTLVVSEAEKEWLMREAPHIAIDIVTLIEEPDPTETTFEEREGLIFVANFSHLPNCDGLEYYLRRIHPLVREQLGGAKLTVIGADPPGRLEELAGEGVRFAGHVEDLRSEFARARLTVAPLRFGAGIKGKVCTSMSLGVPVVATSVGAEGMNLENGEDALIANTPEAFAGAVAAAYSDPDLWSRLVRNGLRKVTTQFSPQRAEAALARILEIQRG